MVPLQIQQEMAARKFHYCTMVGGAFNGKILEINPMSSIVGLASIRKGSIPPSGVESMDLSQYEFLKYARRFDNPLYFDFIQDLPRLGDGDGE